MHASIVTIGTELTRGELVDTNAAWLSAELVKRGFEVVSHVTVDDDRTRIEACLAGMARADRDAIVLVTGGLGPTTDDLTTECVARVLGVPIVRDAASLDAIAERFAKRGRTMTPSNEKQADFPAGAAILKNGVGTAPGFSVTLEKTRFFFMPGVPREMKHIFEHEIVPRIAPLVVATTHQIHLRTFGLGESRIGEMLHGIEGEHPGVTLGYRAHFPEVEVKVHARASDLASAVTLAEAATREVRTRLGEYVYGEGTRSLAEVVGAALIEKGLTLALCESCTGGLVSHELTRIAGSSAYFLAGAVTYANSAKMAFAGVSEATLAAHGAVSAETAREMAEGIRVRSGADLAVSITGVAGPSGGSPEKPVGTVYLALATAKGTETKHVLFPGERFQVQGYAAYTALDWIRREVALLDHAR